MQGLRGVPTSVNRQPAIAFYQWRQHEGAYLPLTLDVLRVTGGAITEIITFHDDRFARSACRSACRRGRGMEDDTSKIAPATRPAPAQPAPPALRGTRRHRLRATLAAMVATPVAAAARAAGIDFEVPEGGETIPVTGFAVVPASSRSWAVIAAACCGGALAPPAVPWTALSLTAISLVPPAPLRGGPPPPSPSSGCTSSLRR